MTDDHKNSFSGTPGDQPPQARPVPAAPDDGDEPTVATPLPAVIPGEETRPLRPVPTDRASDLTDEPTTNLSRADLSRPDPARPDPARPGPPTDRGLETKRLSRSDVFPPPAEAPAAVDRAPLQPAPLEPAPVEPAKVEPAPLEPATVELEPDEVTRPLWPRKAEPSPDPVTATADAADPGIGEASTTDREPPASPDGAGTAGTGGGGVTAVREKVLGNWRRVSGAGALIGVLLALFGFTLVVQLRSNDGDQGLATARQEDLVRILSDLEARDSRLQSEINALETSQRQLTSGVAGRQAALAEAAKRADELGLLAGTLPARGPGLRIVLDKVKASAVLNAVQELRGSGGEVMQLGGADGTTVRIVASSYFVDAEGGGLLADGVRLTGPFTLDVIGSPSTMQPALQIPGGVVASVNGGGGSVTMEQRTMVEVTALRKATTLQYARPVS